MRLLGIWYMCSIIIDYKNRWSYGHPNRLGLMNRWILGTCVNQYETGTTLIDFDFNFNLFVLYLRMKSMYYIVRKRFQ